MNTPPTYVPDCERLQALSKQFPDLDPLDVRTAVLLKTVGQELSSYLQMNLEDYGISEGRIRVLIFLLDIDTPATHSLLAEAIGVTKGTITGLVDGLESDGHVRRKPSDSDRRVMHIELTPKGKRLLHKVLPGHLRRLSELMSGISKNERKTLIGLLEKARLGLRPEGEAGSKGSRA